MYRSCASLKKDHIYECSLFFSYVGFEVALPRPSPLSTTRDVKLWSLLAVGTRKRKLPPIQMLPGHLISFTIWSTSISDALSLLD